MVSSKKTLSLTLGTMLCLALLPLAGCDKTNAPGQPATPDAALAPVKAA